MLRPPPSTLTRALLAPNPHLIFIVASIHTRPAVRKEKEKVHAWHSFKNFLRNKAVEEPAAKKTSVLDGFDLQRIGAECVETEVEEDRVPLRKPANAEELRQVVREVVLANVENASAVEASWMSVKLSDPSLKFKILKESVAKTGKDIPNLVLNNIATVQDAVDFFLAKEAPRKGSAVQQFFEEKKDKIPANVRFEPSFNTIKVQIQKEEFTKKKARQTESMENARRHDNM
ncbi:hypothetical protein BC936DRAFT_144818 [Jimgerdemannia flammicorona]|uniref:Large ribosomal subunit protein mL50 n=1 Tax=Jimgerdemannia flammicorona TaxID=994334 RepID=A0A433DBM0_9FUNG|nr:hypothetical protein BC936DRAFT_144818 [Jimgerdemannia flammicorona]